MSTISNVLKVHPADNVLVALSNLEKGTVVSFEGQEYTITENVKAKHKFAMVDLAPGDPVTMYGVLVGKAQQPIAKGGSDQHDECETCNERFYDRGTAYGMGHPGCDEVQEPDL